eukprot:12231261-Alexandrium_andersonii.AAC.1
MATLHVVVIHGAVPLVRVSGLVPYELAPWLILLLLDGEEHGASDGTPTGELLAQGRLVLDEFLVRPDSH